MKIWIKGLLAFLVMSIFGILTFYDFNDKDLVKYEDLLTIHYELD